MDPAVEIRYQGEMLSTLAWSATGFAVTPLLEWVWHAKIAHGGRKDATAEAHLLHHRTAHTVAEPWTEMRENAPRLGLTALAVTAIALPLIGPRRALALSAGMLAGYAFSTLYHAQMHQRGPETPYEDFMWRFHWHHHAADAHVNFGLTNPVFDFAFGTAVVPETVTIGARLAPAWLQGDVPGFVVRGRPHVATA